MEAEEAIDFVESWRNDDEELRIPSNEFGGKLAEAVDRVLELARYGWERS